MSVAFHRCFFGLPWEPRTTERGKLLDRVLMEKGLRSCARAGSYGWCRMDGYVKALQQKLVELRAHDRPAYRCRPSDQPRTPQHDHP